jgi:hypothetical protein
VLPSEFLEILRHYLAEELKQSWAFLAAAVGAIAAGSWLWRTHSAFRHALWPLVLVAGIQLAAGSITLLRSPQLSSQWESRLAADAGSFKASELLRLTGLLDAFRFYKLAEIAALLTAIGLALFLPHNDTARGWALGLLLQSAVLLAATLVAEQRTEAYLDVLRRL